MSRHSYGTPEYEEEQKKVRSRIQESRTIGGITFWNSPDRTKLIIQVGKEKVEWDYYDMEAFNDIKYTIAPELPEEAALKAMAKNGGK